MSTIKINDKNCTLEINKTFAAKASIFDSKAYILLRDARNDHPTYRVVIIAQKTVKPVFKGLTYKYMEKYISNHDDENNSIMKEYKSLRAKDTESEEMLDESFSYQEIKVWFLNRYPQIAAHHEARARLLDRKAA